MTTRDVVTIHLPASVEEVIAALMTVGRTDALRRGDLGGYSVDATRFQVRCTSADAITVSEVSA